MTNPTINNRRNQLIGWPSLERQEKESPAKRTAGSHLPVMPEKLICTLTTHTHQPQTQIKYQYAGQSLPKAKRLKETAQKMLYTIYYLEETSIK